MVTAGSPGQITPGQGEAQRQMAPRFFEMSCIVHLKREGTLSTPSEALLSHCSHSLPLEKSIKSVSPRLRYTIKIFQDFVGDLYRK